MEYDHTFKIAMLGDCMVGKSSLISREVYGDFVDKYEATIAVGFCSKKVVYYNKKIKLNVWDLSGDIRFRTVLKTYLKHVHAVIIVYDVTNINSFNNVKQWIELVKSVQTNKVNFVLLANKIDKKEKRVVNVDMGIRYALKNNMMYLDVSAKIGKTMKFLNMLTEVLMEKCCIETKFNKSCENIKINTMVQKINENLLIEEKNTNIEKKKEMGHVKWCSCGIF